ncbi:MAG: hypothetical protein ACKVHP_03195 [Verrucomicrobiales bacterium]
MNDRCGFFGGVEQNVADCAIGLRDKGHQVYFAFGDELGTRDAIGYRNLFEAARPCQELGDFEGATAFKDILSDIQPDCVYLHKVTAIKPFLDT